MFSFRAMEIREVWGLSDVAERLGIEPDLGALFTYVESKLKPGMSYEEVHGELQAIGPYEVEFAPGLSSRFGYGETVEFDFRWGVDLEIGLDYTAGKRLREAARLESSD
jgi:hypothetical protein